MITYQDWKKANPEKAGLVAICAAAIRQVVPDADVILYGSVARGEERLNSDVDLLILVPLEITPSLKRAISDQIYEIELQSGQLISSIIRRRRDWDSPPLCYMPLHRSVEREGVRV